MREQVGHTFQVCAEGNGFQECVADVLRSSATEHDSRYQR